jgi:hypothetical protein
MKAEKYFEWLFDKAAFLAGHPADFETEAQSLRDFDGYAANGTEKYFRPETKRQLRDQRIQMKLAKQLQKARLS